MSLVGIKKYSKAVICNPEIALPLRWEMLLSERWFTLIWRSDGTLLIIVVSAFVVVMSWMAFRDYYTGP